MQNSQIIKAGFFVVLFLTVMLLPVHTFSAAQKANNWLDEPVTIRFQNEPLSKVLEKVSKQTGIAILYDQELANDKVSGNYKDVKASDAITRLFSGKNKSIQVSKNKKVIIVKTFGAKKFIWAGSSQGAQGKGQDSEPMTLAELDKLHAKQYKKYKERIANDNEVIEGGENPMTRGEIREMHEQQYKDYRARLVNDDEIIEGGEKPMTRGAIREMHEQQYKEYNERISIDDEVIGTDEDGESMTRGQIGILHEQQHKDYQIRLANDDEIIEGGEDGKDMTRGEIRAMHDKQNEEYKIRQKNRSRIVD